MAQAAIATGREPPNKLITFAFIFKLYFYGCYIPSELYGFKPLSRPFQAHNHLSFHLYPPQGVLRCSFLSRTRTSVSGVTGVLPIILIREIKSIAVDFTELFQYFFPYAATYFQLSTRESPSTSTPHADHLSVRRESNPHNLLL